MARPVAHSNADKKAPRKFERWAIAAFVFSLVGLALIALALILFNFFSEQISSISWFGLALFATQILIVPLLFFTWLAVGLSLV